MCVEYDVSYAKHCKEPIAEEVRKKDEANFCDFFKPRAKMVGNISDMKKLVKNTHHNPTHRTTP